MSDQTFQFIKGEVFEVHQMMAIRIRWADVPWWKRMQAVAELPFQVVRLVVTGNADILCVRNVRTKR